MDHELKAFRLRYLAARHRLAAAQYDLAVAYIPAARAFKQLAEAHQRWMDQTFSEHPDVAYLDAQLEGFYGGAAS